MRVKPLLNYIRGKDFPPGMSIHKPGDFLREVGLIPVKLRIGYKHDSRTGKNNPDNPTEYFKIFDYVDEYKNDNELLWKIFDKIKDGDGKLYDGREITWDESTHFFLFFKQEKQPSIIESIAESVLEEMSVEHESQVSFSWSRIKYSNFIYDFLLPRYKILIELDGKQHRTPVKFFGGEDALETQKIRDNRKELIAIEHGYSVLRIPEHEICRFKEILTKILKRE